MIADMATEVDAATMLMWRAAWLAGDGKDALREITMAKLFASETYAKVANMGVQVMGGYGLNAEYDMQRFFRAMRAARPSPLARRRPSATSSRPYGAEAALNIMVNASLMFSADHPGRWASHAATFSPFPFALACGRRFGRRSGPGQREPETVAAARQPERSRERRPRNCSRASRSPADMAARSIGFYSPAASRAVPRSASMATPGR